MKKKTERKMWGQMNILIVYCHPSTDSFTYGVKEAFIKGIREAGHSYEVSDLYQMGFQPVMSENEYLREAFYREDLPLPQDVITEQEKINHADMAVFIYPVFWTAAPAVLEGWFQRVWTYGFAYGSKPTMRKLKKTYFLVTMGGSLHDEIRKYEVEAMKAVMVGDRMHNRTEESEFIVFDEMTRGYGNDSKRMDNIEKFTRMAYELGKTKCFI